MPRVYQTRQQKAVQKLFSARPEDCLTAEEAYDQLTIAGMEVGKTTVYRAITRLLEQGLLRRYAAQDSSEAASYQYNPCVDSHLHIRCMDCGVLEHLHCDEVEHFSAHLAHHHGFTLDEGQTMLYGLCKACQGKQQEKK
ncbi:MAG: transcriptional repressor [Clostridiales bacterium]|nr:transcriptional repressor [Clostridiales bacterium]